MSIEFGIWIYWACCLVPASALASNWDIAQKLLRANHMSLDSQLSRRVAFTVGWMLTILTAVTYVIVSRKLTPGSYPVTDIIAFAVINGVLEQIMFVSWFLLGVCIASGYTDKSTLRFSAGYVLYFIFSGLIHALFWVRVLPPHIPAMLPMAILLSATSLMWLWLLWRYGSLGTIICMHIFMDLLMIGHLHTQWFESLARL